MSAQFVFKEAQKRFYQTVKYSNTDTYSITVPTINKIDEIDVKCNLAIYKEKADTRNKYFIGFIIESKKISQGCPCCSNNKYILYSLKEKLFCFTPKTINKFLLRAKNDILPNMKLDKVFGKFILIGKDGKKQIQEENVGEDIFGYEYSNCTKCSVCYELTYTHTSCNHPLCVSCWNQIENDVCPICRNKLAMNNELNGEIDEESYNENYYHYANGDEDDDDDDEDEEDDDEDDDEDEDDVLNTAFIADDEDNNSTTTTNSNNVNFRDMLLAELNNSTNNDEDEDNEDNEDDEDDEDENNEYNDIYTEQTI